MGTGEQEVLLGRGQGRKPRLVELAVQSLIDFGARGVKHRPWFIMAADGLLS